MTVTRPDSDFGEAGAERHLKSVAYSHLSVELGHLYFEDIDAGPEALRAHFTTIAGWADAAQTMHSRTLGVRTPRISTCFLIDDYFGPTRSPAHVLPWLLEIAAECGLRIDYLARESGCADADGVPVARLVEGRIVADPPPETTGSRPPVTESGWLSNGQRTPVTSQAEAMSSPVDWTPPTENAKTRHSIFVDVELWDERKGNRTWACAYLAAVWQLLRLGMLRHRGAAIASPKPWEGAFPDEWTRLPAVVQLNPSASPFTAYKTLSIIPSRFMPTELAVRTILNQVALDDEIVAQVVARGHVEGMDLPREAIARISYIFGG